MTSISIDRTGRSESVGSQSVVKFYRRGAGPPRRKRCQNRIKVRVVRGLLGPARNQREVQPESFHTWRVQLREMRNLAVLGILTTLALPIGAQRGGGRGGPPPAENAAPATPPKMEDKTSKTEHTISINGQSLKYTPEAGTPALREEDSPGV